MVALGFTSFQKRLCPSSAFIITSVLPPLSDDVIFLIWIVGFQDFSECGVHEYMKRVNFLRFLWKNKSSLVLSCCHMCKERPCGLKKTAEWGQWRITTHVYVLIVCSDWKGELSDTITQKYIQLLFQLSQNGWSHGLDWELLPIATVFTSP